MTRERGIFIGTYSFYGNDFGNTVSVFAAGEWHGP